VFLTAAVQLGRWRFGSRSESRDPWVVYGAVVIRLKRIYNFLCSMLVLTPFALCFVTLRGIFMHFPKLTY
jgi:hypothetical protein